ncbi:hypothetical protein [Pseudidiomarina insulisalsae]|uniref:Alginate biosynthesis protein AlgF n=1 Tax=Pseudidiomarina insulisalsae TaxID=575789 RepID=A0A432YLH2_9GAMM|nr:hypothetical protein [Pseudidiomarina insulisalsae]RUO61796.1 hypothetical protein CWI71_05395 [Pseudidiomarina insulisalsae]
MFKVLIQQKSPSLYAALSFMFAVVYLSSAHAQQLDLSSSEFNEVYASNVPVSGRVLVGIQIVSAETSPNFEVQVPSSFQAKPICLRVRSRDGTYSSENQYQVVGQPNDGLYQVNYPTKYISKLNDFSDNELALLAFPGMCTDDQLDTLMLSFRGEQIVLDDATEVVLFVNSGRSAVFVQLKNDEHGKSVRCDRIEEGIRTGYDTLCRLNYSDLTKVNGAVLLRRQGSRMLPPIKFQVAI